MAESKQDNYSSTWLNRLGFGQRPALLVIDFMKGYTTEGAPLYAPGVVDAVAEMPELLAAARAAGIPVIHTIVRYSPPHFIDGGTWIKKAPVLKDLVDGNPYAECCDGCEPLDDELVVTKQYASSFFGTSLASTLTGLGVDTIILTGCSTSGCIRATAVDGCQHGFRTMVIRECVGDRHNDPHEANLFDIDAKYGDVVSKQEVLEYFKTVSA